MAHSQYSKLRRVILIYLLLYILQSLYVSADPATQPPKNAKAKPVKMKEEAHAPSNLTQTSKSKPQKSPSPLLPKRQHQKLNQSRSPSPPSVNKTVSIPTKPHSKNSNSTTPIKKSTDPSKPAIVKNKISDGAKNKSAKEEQKTVHPIWSDNDLVAEFRDLPLQFHRSLLPDLERISTTSMAYLDKANSEITKGFKPIVGTRYAPTIASLVSLLFILVPLVFVSLLINRIKAYFSLQKMLIFIQAYLAIYFFILCLSALLTGTEPLEFLQSMSPSTYACLQLMQTIGYVFYLLFLIVYFVLVFSTDTSVWSKMLALLQTFIGYTVGLHCYVTVVHRTVLGLPPRTSWIVHSSYAACFIVISLVSIADRRKKSYLEDGGARGKLN